MVIDDAPFLAAASCDASWCFHVRWLRCGQRYRRCCVCRILRSFRRRSERCARPIDYDIVKPSPFAFRLQLPETMFAVCPVLSFMLVHVPIRTISSLLLEEPNLLGTARHGIFSALRTCSCRRGVPRARVRHGAPAPVRHCATHSWASWYSTIFTPTHHGCLVFTPNGKASTFRFRGFCPQVVSCLRCRALLYFYRFNRSLRLGALLPFQSNIVQLGTFTLPPTSMLCKVVAATDTDLGGSPRASRRR